MTNCFPLGTFAIRARLGFALRCKRYGAGILRSSNESKHRLGDICKMDYETTAHGMDDFNRQQVLRARITALIAGAAIAPLSYEQAQTVAGVVMDLFAEYLRERDAT